jgi:hypothetical protein
MITRHQALWTALCVTLVACTTGQAPYAQEPGSPVPLVTTEQYERWQTELSNWGRWGPEDELGAANLITSAKRAEAARLVREGFTVSLSSNAQKYESLDNPCPIDWSMVRASRTGASDRLAYPCIHGPGTTHLDAFAHVFFDGKMWNGYDVDDVVTLEAGATRNSIMNVKDGLVTRGVLYDIPRLKDVPYLEPGARITVDDLEAWEARTGVKVGPGDAFLIRWGRWARQEALGPFDTGQEAAGLDNGDLSRVALHNFALTILGIQVLDRADFQALANAAAARNRWEFMVTIAPLPIPNGTGSPVNPIAMF